MRNKNKFSNVTNSFSLSLNHIFHHEYLSWHYKVYLFVSVCCFCKIYLDIYGLSRCLLHFKTHSKILKYVKNFVTVTSPFLFETMLTSTFIIYICFVPFLLLVFVVLYSVSWLNTRRIRRLIRASCTIPMIIGFFSVLFRWYLYVWLDPIRTYCNCITVSHHLSLNSVVDTCICITFPRRMRTFKLSFLHTNEDKNWKSKPEIAAKSPNYYTNSRYKHTKSGNGGIRLP